MNITVCSITNNHVFKIFQSNFIIFRSKSENRYFRYNALLSWYLAILTMKRTANTMSIFIIIHVMSRQCKCPPPPQYISRQGFHKFPLMSDTERCWRQFLICSLWYIIDYWRAFYINARRVDTSNLEVFQMAF